MAALTRWPTLSQNVNKLANLPFHRLQNISRSPWQCQSFKQFMILSRVKPIKYQQGIFTPVRNFISKRSPVISQTPQPGLLSKLLKPLGFCAVVSTSSTAALLYCLNEKIKNTSKSHKTPKQVYLDFVKIVIGIIGINCSVFLLWRVPQLTSYMHKYFTCANGNPVMSMLLSAFSHNSGVHLVMNMYVFWTFSGVLVKSMGQPEVLAWLYINGAVFSSLASLMFKATQFSTIPSVGASGAILTCIACVCYAIPKATLGIPVLSDLTGLSFTAENGLKGIMLIDLCGVLFRWKFFDHAGHLGGVLFGLWFMHYGRHFMKKILQKSPPSEGKKK